MDVSSFKASVLLAFQESLTDMITPGLRGVAVDSWYPIIMARFFYEEITEETLEIISEVETYVFSSFPSSVGVHFKAELLPLTADIEAAKSESEEWVYIRWEGEGCLGAERKKFPLSQISPTRKVSPGLNPFWQIAALDAFNSIVVSPGVSCSRK